MTESPLPSEIRQPWRQLCVAVAYLEYSRRSAPQHRKIAQGNTYYNLGRKMKLVRERNYIKQNCLIQVLFYLFWLVLHTTGKTHVLVSLTYLSMPYQFKVFVESSRSPSVLSHFFPCALFSTSLKRSDRVSPLLSKEEFNSTGNIHTTCSQMLRLCVSLNCPRILLGKIRDRQCNSQNLQ